MRLRAILMASILISNCTDGNSGRLFVGPYGEWRGDEISISIYPNDTYRFCNSNDCVEGSVIRGRYTSLEVQLLDVFSAGKFGNLRQDIEACSKFSVSTPVQPLNDFSINTVSSIQEEFDLYVSKPVFEVGCDLSRVWRFSKIDDYHDQRSLDDGAKLAENLKRHGRPSATRIP